MKIPFKRPEPLTDKSPCPVNGKYHDVPMEDVPARFLDWFRGQPHLLAKYPTVADYIQRNKKVIDWELEDQDSQDDGEDYEF